MSRRRAATCYAPAARHATADPSGMRSRMTSRSHALRAAEKDGRATDLENELDALFNSHNKSPNKDVTSIPATFLRVTVSL